jgi:hypothetical protein
MAFIYLYRRQQTIIKPQLYPITNNNYNIVYNDKKAFYHYMTHRLIKQK